MEIHVLQEEELKAAAGLSRYVFDHALRDRMEFEQTIAFVEEYLKEENLRSLYQQATLQLWGAFEEEMLVGVGGLQSDGMITMLYVLPQFSNKGIGSSHSTPMLRGILPTIPPIVYCTRTSTLWRENPRLRIPVSKAD